MKPPDTTRWVFFWLCPAGFSQLVLHQGDSYTYRFDSLPFVGVTTGTGSALPAGFLLVSGRSINWQPGDLLRLELFEDDIGPTPLQTGSIPFALQPDVATGQGENFAWQDLQGAIRVSSDAGSFIIDKVILEVSVPFSASQPSLSFYHLEFTPVPEPGTLWWLAIFAVAGIPCLRGCRKRRRV
jgi:hypothetical protein